MVETETRTFLTQLFNAAVKAADPRSAIAAHLPERPKGRTVVVGAGKAASQMAAALEDLWDGPLEGVVVDRHGPVAETQTIRVLQSAHPVPDAAGLKASQALLDAVAGLSEDDLVIALISGGGSALLPAPVDGLSFDDEVAVNKVLLASGAPISAMNVVRKHISRIKGGQLAQAAHPARVVSLIVSDVAGDDPALVASGPTVPGPGTAADALKIIDTFGMALPEAVLAHLHTAKDSPEPSDAVFARNEIKIIASAAVSLEAAAAEANAQGIAAVILSDAMEGEAREVGRVHAALAREIAHRNRPFPKPVVLLSGGETTVTIGSSKAGRGGRNSEFLLGFALAIEGVAGIEALAADTDGIDGSEHNAGAFADGESTMRMRTMGVDPALALHTHDAFAAFDAAGDLFVPGPTGTNVNDFRALLVR